MKKQKDRDVVEFFFPEFYNNNINLKTGKVIGWIPTRFDKPRYATLRGAKQELEYHWNHSFETAVDGRLVERITKPKHRIVKKRYKVFAEEEIYLDPEK